MSHSGSANKDAAECLAQPELATGMPVVAGYGRREPGLHLGRRGDDAAHLEKLRSLGYID